MSLDNVEVDLSRAFAPGQGYVALSRARTLEGLTLHGLNATALQVHPYVRMRDETLQSESVRWENVFTKFSATRVKELHEEFVEKVGRSEAEVTVTSTIPTHLKTRALLEEGQNIEAVMETRGMTRGTILSHLEKLKDLEDTDIYEHVKPEEEIVKEISKVFSKQRDLKLSPVHRKLKGKYTYEDLRLARLFIKE